MPRRRPGTKRRMRPPATPPRRFAGFSKRALTTPRPDRTQKTQEGARAAPPPPYPRERKGKNALVTALQRTRSVASGRLGSLLLLLTLLVALLLVGRKVAAGGP